MKRIITVMVVMALVGGAAFARGSNENANSNGRGMGNGNTNGEQVAISGTVEELNGQVVLRTADGIYSLSAPGFSRAGIDVPYGETIEVQGSKAEALADCDIEAEGHIFVSAAEVNGEELSFSNGQRGMGQDNRNESGPVNTSKGNSGQGNSGRGGRGRSNSSQGNSGQGGRR